MRVTSILGRFFRRPSLLRILIYALDDSCESESNGGGIGGAWHNIADRPIRRAFCNASHVVLCNQLRNNGTELPLPFNNDFLLLDFGTKTMLPPAN